METRRRQGTNEEKRDRFTDALLILLLAILAVMAGVRLGDMWYKLDASIIENIDVDNFKNTINLSFPLIETVYNSGKASVSFAGEVRELFSRIFGFDPGTPVTILNIQSPLFMNYYKKAYGRKPADDGVNEEKDAAMRVASEMEKGESNGDDAKGSANGGKLAENGAGGGYAAANGRKMANGTGISEEANKGIDADAGTGAGSGMDAGSGDNAGKNNAMDKGAGEAGSPGTGGSAGRKAGQTAAAGKGSERNTGGETESGAGNDEAPGAYASAGKEKASGVDGGSGAKSGGAESKTGSQGANAPDGNAGGSGAGNGASKQSGNTHANEDGAAQAANPAGIQPASSIMYEIEDENELDKSDTVAMDKIVIRNFTKNKIDIAGLLREPLDIDFSKKGPKVLVYHTHTSESYVLKESDLGKSGVPSYRTDPRYNVVRVGEELARHLKRYGIETLHNGTVHDKKRDAAYGVSVGTLQSYKKSYPSIKVFIDVHRDGLDASKPKLRLVKNINGKNAAQIMFVVGTDGMLPHPQWRENLKFVLKLQQKLNEKYPGLARPIWIVGKRYNQQISNQAILVEIGGDGNLLGECLESAKYLAEVLNDVLNGRQ